MADMPTLRTYLLKFPEVPHEGRNDIEDTFVDDYSVITVISWAYVGRTLRNGGNIHLWSLVSGDAPDQALLYWLDVNGFRNVEILASHDEPSEEVLSDGTILAWEHIVDHVAARSTVAFHQGYVMGSNHAEAVQKRRMTPRENGGYIFDATYYPETMMMRHNPDLYFRLVPSPKFAR